MLSKAKIDTVHGQRIPKPRLAPGAVWVAFVYAIAPVLAVGALLDLVAQLGFGHCTGVWCLAAR